MKKIWIVFSFISILLTLLIVGCNTTNPSSSSSTATSPTPIAIISVYGPISPINPGGPNVSMTLKNVSDQPVVSLTAALELNRSFDFNFDVSSTHPLSPNASIQTTQTLIGGGFNSGNLYTVKINGSFQNGTTFSYNETTKIIEPSAGSPFSSP